MRIKKESENYTTSEINKFNQHVFVDEFTTRYKKIIGKEDLQPIFDYEFGCELKNVSYFKLNTIYFNAAGNFIEIKKRYSDINVDIQFDDCEELINVQEMKSIHCGKMTRMIVVNDSIFYADQSYLEIEEETEE